MLTSHLKEALNSVRQIQRTVLERQRFRGYSGRTRMLSGLIAFLGAALMASPIYPQHRLAHLVGWGVVFVIALLINGAAVIYWFLFDPRVGRDVFRLRPLLDPIPPLFVGGVLTAALILHGEYDYLFGVWMCMFGLSNLSSHYVLPRAIALVGLFYVACGTVWLLHPGAGLLDPWPMGLVFLAGEVTAGLILHFDERRYLSLVRHMDNGEVVDDRRS